MSVLVASSIRTFKLYTDDGTAEESDSDDSASDDGGTGLSDSPLISPAGAILILMVALTCVIPIVHTCLRRRRQAAAEAENPPPIPLKPKKERYADIESKLVSRKIQLHQDSCTNKEEEEVTGTARDEELGSETSGEEEQLECSICMDPLVVGQIVSWSPNERCCQNVFHHQCIKEWLLRKTGCPYCRETFLPPSASETEKEHPTEEHSKTSYCLRDGVVESRVLTKSNSSRCIVTECRIPSPAELAGLRADKSSKMMNETNSVGEEPRASEQTTTARPSSRETTTARPSSGDSMIALRIAEDYRL